MLTFELDIMSASVVASPLLTVRGRGAFHPLVVAAATVPLLQRLHERCECQRAETHGILADAAAGG